MRCSSLPPCFTGWCLPSSSWSGSWIVWVCDAGNQKENHGWHQIHPVLWQEASVILRLATITRFSFFLNLLDESGGVWNRRLFNGFKIYYCAELVKLIDVVQGDCVTIVGNGFKIYGLMIDSQNSWVVVEWDGQEVVELRMDQITLKVLRIII